MRGRRRTDLRARLGEVVLDRRMRQAEAVGRCLLRAGNEDGDDHPDLTVRGASGAAFSHASRLAAASHSSRPSIGIS
jgi:hypothetical protein